MSELMSFETDSIAVVEIAKGVTLSIHQAVKQEGFPYSQKYFGYKPLFMPTISENSYKITCKQSPKTLKWEIHISIDTDSLSVKNLVLSEIKRLKANEKTIDDLSVKTIYARPLYGFKFTKFICDGDTFSLKPDVNEFEQVSSISPIEVIVVAESKEEASRIIEHASTIRIDCSYSYNKVVRDTNKTTISWESLLETALFKQLKGEGKKFIRREDVRRCIEGLCQQVSVIQDMDRPEFDKTTDYIDKILRDIENSYKNFQTNFQNHTQQPGFDENDIKANVLTLFLDEEIRYRQNKSDISHEGEVDLTSTLTGVSESKQKVSHKNSVKTEKTTNDETKKRIEGSFYTPKDLFLVSDVVGFFESRKTYTFDISYRTRQNITETDTINFSKFNYTNVMEEIQLKIAQLEKQVNMLVPIGTISTFAGNSPNIDCWLLCDGRLLSKDEYPELFKKIEYFWGGKEDKFRVPDMQGRFLRGVANNESTDPDKERRIYNSNFDKAKSNGVGSYQEDAISKHKHQIRISNTLNASYGARSILTSSQNENTATGGEEELIQNFGGNETRPKNAYVNFFIKIK